MLFQVSRFRYRGFEFRGMLQGRTSTIAQMHKPFANFLQLDLHRSEREQQQS